MLSFFNRDFLRADIPRMYDDLDSIHPFALSGNPLADVLRIRCTAPSKPNEFKLMLNVKHFSPEEVEVKVVDDYIEVHAKHEEKADEHGFVTREFRRRSKIPEDVDRSTINSVFNKNGHLIVRGIRKVEQPKGNVRIVPIEVQKPVDLIGTDRPTTPQMVDAEASTTASNA